MGGDLSAVIASESRRPRTSKCLVKADSRPVQIATPAFQPTPGLPRFRPGHQVSYQRFWENRWIPDSLPTGQRPRRKPPHVEPTLIKVKRHLPSMSFYESHRRQPSITRFARIKQTAVWRLKPFPLRSKVIRLQLAMPLLSPQGKNDRLRYRSAEWTVILRGPRD